MQSGGGKRKGSAYERAVCKKLSLWISTGLREDLLWRSASSGAVHTISRKKGSKAYASQAGDIAAIDTEGEPFAKLFAVECKHYADLQLQNIVMGTKSILEDFVLKHFKLAKAVNKVPLLIVRQNRSKDLLIGPGFFEKQFLTVDSIYIKRHNYCIFNLDNFITEMPFSNFINLVGNPPNTRIRNK
jgi:hypothetical protein